MIYVTGITGYSGHWFLERLVKDNYKGKLRCVVRKDSDMNFLDNSGLDIEQVLRMEKDKAFGYEEARRDFGYSPVSFEEGIVEEVNEYLAKTNSTKTKQR